MPKITISVNNEWYPITTFDNEVDSYSETIVVSEEELTRFNKVFEDFDNLQRELNELYARQRKS